MDIWNLLTLTGLAFDRPVTPNSDDETPRNETPDIISRPKDLSDDEEYPQQSNTRKKGGYDSRIEQILCENDDLQIIITDAGKSHESGGSYIVYTIRTGVRQPVLNLTMTNIPGGLRSPATIL